MEEFKNYLKNLQAENGWNSVQLSKATGIPRKSIQHILNENRKVGEMNFFQMQLIAFGEIRYPYNKNG